MKAYKPLSSVSWDTNIICVIFESILFRIVFYCNNLHTKNKLVTKVKSSLDILEDLQYQN